MSEDAAVKDVFFPEGGLRMRQYLAAGKRHRDPEVGPAVETFYPDGVPEHREFWEAGTRRTRGFPAAQAERLVLNVLP